MSTAVGAAAAGSGFVARQEARAQEEDENLNNILDNIKQFPFIDQDGNPVSMDLLKAKLGGSSVAMSFFYPGCLTIEDDKQIMSKQAQIAKGLPPGKLKYLVFDTNPYSDTFPEMQAPLLNVTGKYIPTEDTIILFALKAPGRPFTDLQEALLRVREIEQATGVWAVTDPSVKSLEPSHNSTVNLYGPGGTQLFSDLAADIDTDKWKAAIMNPPQQGIGH